jgi:hypothetical protein
MDAVQAEFHKIGIRQQASGISKIRRKNGAEQLAQNLTAVPPSRKLFMD